MSTSTHNDSMGRILRSACAGVGLDPAGAEPIRIGENAIFRLPGQVVVRIARLGQSAAAAKEVRIARWFADLGLPAVRAVDGIDQPVEVEGRAVTFWREVPAHRHGTVVEIAGALRLLHDLPVPIGLLDPLDPFVRLVERINAATVLGPDDRAWLLAHLPSLRGRYLALPDGMAHTVVHGDAWMGNLVTTVDGQTIMLDLERCSVGPPEWDLVSTAIRLTSFGWLSQVDYARFCSRYGQDVTDWPGYELLRDIRELRMTSYRLQRAGEDPTERPEAERRLACLRGRNGPRPWRWAS